MHHLSFESHNPVFDFCGLHFSVQVFTFQNVYEPDARALSVRLRERSLEVEADSLVWAGGQETAEGRIRVDCRLDGDKALFHVWAAHTSEDIRRVKLTIHGIPAGAVANLRQPSLEGPDCPIPAEGMILKYPDGFTGLYTPLMILRHPGGRLTYFRSRDNRVRPKVFALLHRDGALDIELIYEADARSFGREIDVPTWEVASSDCYEAIMEEQRDIIARDYSLISWERRPDVPDWARGITLVTSIHCRHWTGYVFNSYEDVIANLNRIARQVDPKRILAYLPGWEGRYYYQYGEFSPCPKLGGPKGFRKLMDAAREMGTHIMPMFMINGANPHHEGFGRWGKDSFYVNPSGFPQYWGSCDWDTSRHYDHNCGMALNPGAPLWQDHLVNQVRTLIDEYGFEGVFMDLAAVYCNDLRYDTHQAAVDIARRIREGHPEVLMAGEGWYDAISAAMPLTQPSLTVEGDCRWSDRPHPPLFDTWNRSFAHLGMGDPSRASTGVFEFGYNPLHQSTPLQKGIIPTLTVVDGTLDVAWEKCEAVFRQANEYARLYLPAGGA